MDTVVLAIRILLAVVFATAGVGKLLDLQGSKAAARDFGVPRSLASVVGVALPIVELAAAVMLVLRPTVTIGAALSLVLLLAFIGGIANALRQGVAPNCHCFGQIHSEPAGPSTLIRNGILAALSVFVLVEGKGPALDTWIGDRSAAELVAVVAVLALVLLAFWTFQIWSELKVLRKDIGAARRQAASAPPGLPVGAQAPEFELETLDGAKVTLGSLLEPGNPVLLVFTSPWCSNCAEIFPNLRRWQQTLSERLTIALVSVGEAADNRPYAQEHGLERLLMQEDAEVFESYRIRGTPSAVLVTADGKIGTLPAESAFGIEPMVRLVLRGDQLAGATQSSAA
jgi:methylamine dehydrogenase accessory protein MauD